MCIRPQPAYVVFRAPVYFNITMKIKFLLITTLLFSTGAYAQNMFNMASLHPADTSMSEGRQLAI